MVRGKGTQTSDSIDAKLSTGESVLNAGATKALKALLKKTGGMTIDEFNAEHAPKDAKTKVVDGVLHAAAGIYPVKKIDDTSIPMGVMPKMQSTVSNGLDLSPSKEAALQMSMTKRNVAQQVNPVDMASLANKTANFISPSTTAATNVLTSNLDSNQSVANNAGRLISNVPAAIGAGMSNSTIPKAITAVANSVDPVVNAVKPVANDFIAGMNGEVSPPVKTTAPIASIAPPTAAPDATAKVGVAPTVMNTQQSVLPKAPSSLAVGEFMPEVSKTSGNMSPVGKAPDTNTTYTASPVVEGQPTASVSFKQGTATMAKNTGVAPRADANGDGNLSGSEQYLRDNQDTQGGNYVSPTYMANQRNSAVQMDSYAGQNMARDKGYQSVNDAEGNIRAALGAPRVNGANPSESVMTVDNGRGGTGTISGSGAGMARLGTPEAQARISKELATNADPAFQARMAEQTKIVDDRIAKRQANEAVINNAAQRNALIAQTKQSGNIGDKARRDSAKEQLAALDANARNDQDNKYKMASLGQDASQFEQQQQAAMATAKNTATKDERDYQLKKAESDKPMDFFTPQFEKDGVTPVVDEVTGVQKQVRETMRPSEREARQQSANNQKLTSTLSQLSKVVNDPSASKEDKAAAAQFIATHGKGQ